MVRYDIKVQIVVSECKFVIPSLSHNISITIEPSHDKTNKVACAPSEDSDQPGHPSSLMRVFAWVFAIHWAHSEDSDQTGRMPRLMLIWVFAGRTVSLLGLSWDGSIYTISGSPWTEILSNEVIFFQEKQDISKLYIKWWIEKSGGKCNIPKKKKASSLEVENVGGVFVVLLGGTGCGFLIALIEFMWRAFRNARADKVLYS